MGRQRNGTGPVWAFPRSPKCVFVDLALAPAGFPLHAAVAFYSFPFTFCLAVMS